MLVPAPVLTLRSTSLDFLLRGQWPLFLQSGSLQQSTPLFLAFSVLVAMDSVSFIVNSGGAEAMPFQGPGP